MKAVITGATGVVGMALIQEMISNKDEVLIICHSSSKRTAAVPISPYVKTLELDMEEYKSYQPKESAESVDKRYDVFYHLAWAGTSGLARDDARLQYQNIGYALDAVYLAEKLGCHTFIGAGSQAEYGRVNGKLSADTPPFPENAYGCAKLCAGQMTRGLCEKRGIRHIWARLLSVYGPYDSPNAMIVTSVRRMLKGESPKFTGGEQMWDYLYGADAANALYLLAQKGVHGRTYPIGSGIARPLKEYITLMRDAVDKELPLALGALPYQKNQVMYLCADIAQLQKDTGFQPQVSFADGIKEVVRHLRQEGELT